MILRLPGRMDQNKTDDELLKEYASRSDPEVLGELYSRYMHLVYGVCLKYLRDREESMDAVMQIFEKLLAEIPRHKIENFRSWLHAVTRNYCLMSIRSKKSSDEKLSEWLKDSSVIMENIQEMHPIDNDGSLMEKALEDCIQQLREEQKQCIRLFYYESRCYSEIALSLGIDEKKVKSYLQNGKRNLKICLEEKNVREKEK